MNDEYEKAKNIQHDNNPMRGEVPVELFMPIPSTKSNFIDMNNDVIGKRDIVLLCLDTLRWDVAYTQETNGHTPILNRYGKWTQCHALGNFTYPAHHTLFAGIFPAPLTAQTIFDREKLFFPQGIGMGRNPPQGSFAFQGATIMEGLTHKGYQTNCIGGVGFFDKRSPIGNVFPSMFQHSFWRPTFSCTTKESIDNQIEFICKRLEQTPQQQRVFYYINVSAIHYPNYFYLEGEKEDSVQTHTAALQYVDSKLERLFDAFKQRSDALVIALSDHGTCYGEDGMKFHGLPHPIIDTIPYKRFFL